MMNKNGYLLAAMTAGMVLSTCTEACTDFRLKATDGTLLITRSMEFGFDLKSNLRSSTRGREFTSTTTNNKPGLNWKAKYGYIYVDGFGVDASFDGMNETGLTFEYLYLPGETEYQTIPDGKDSQGVAYYQFGDWVLSNFKTIDEVKAGLANIYVYPQKLPQLGEAILPAHASIYDASGNGIVIEFYNNKINVFENIGVMTNSPKYDWQTTNLRNFLNLSPNDAAAIHKDGMTYAATGQGSGAIGLPGDASPPSRFVKIAFMANNVYPAKDARALLNLAEHIINNVDLPAGYVRSVGATATDTDTTQWVVFKDISHKLFYYRTYDNLALRSVALDKIDFSEKAKALKMPLVMEAKHLDVTDSFLKSK